MDGRVPEKHDLPRHQAVSDDNEASAYSHPGGEGGAGLAEAQGSERLTSYPPALAHSRGVEARELEGVQLGNGLDQACLHRLPRLVRRRVGTEHMASVPRKLGLSVSAALCPVGVA